MANTTRAYTVRVNSKNLGELVLFFERQQGWRINNIGGFLRDLIDLIYTEVQQEISAENLFENSAEAEEFLNKFGSGRTVNNKLAQEVSGQRIVKNPQKAEKQRQRRQRKKEMGWKDETTHQQEGLPPHIRQKYMQLEDRINKDRVNFLIEMDHSWSEIEKHIDEILSEDEQPISDIDKPREQVEKEQREKDQQQLNEMKNQLSQKPPQHNQENG